MIGIYGGMGRTYNPESCQSLTFASCYRLLSIVRSRSAVAPAADSRQKLRCPILTAPMSVRKALTLTVTIRYPPPSNGVKSILVADDENHARGRRVLSHAFSATALAEQEGLLQNYVDQLVRIPEPCRTF